MHNRVTINREQDYLEGEIKVRGKTVSNIFGNYMGFVEFDGKRFYDVRDLNAILEPIISVENALPSDSGKRTDSLTLKAGKAEKAQQVKDQMEEEQRHDRKLRQNAQKQREKKHKKGKFF